MDAVNTLKFNNYEHQKINWKKRKMRKNKIANHKHNLTWGLKQFNVSGQYMQIICYFLNFFQFLRNIFHIQRK